MRCERRMQYDFFDQDYLLKNDTKSNAFSPQ